MSKNNLKKGAESAQRIACTKGVCTAALNATCVDKLGKYMKRQFIFRFGFRQIPALSSRVLLGFP
jgi:hypothetical protein